MKQKLISQSNFGPAVIFSKLNNSLNITVLINKHLMTSGHGCELGWPLQVHLTIRYANNVCELLIPYRCQKVFRDENGAKSSVITQSTQKNLSESLPINNNLACKQ